MHHHYSFKMGNLDEQTPMATPFSVPHKVFCWLVYKAVVRNTFHFLSPYMANSWVNYCLPFLCPLMMYQTLYWPRATRVHLFSLQSSVSRIFWYCDGPAFKSSMHGRRPVEVAPYKPTVRRARSSPSPLPFIILRTPYISLAIVWRNFHAYEGISNQEW